jgi:hypothetical protein
LVRGPGARVPVEPVLVPEGLVRGLPLADVPGGVLFPQALVRGPPVADVLFKPVLVPFDGGMVRPGGTVGALFVGREGDWTLTSGLL